MSSKSHTQVKQLTISAMLCALGVVILALGAVIEVIDLSVSAIASLLCVYAVIELKGAYPWMIWLVTSLVALLLLPVKTPALFYAILVGYYPILKEKIEKKPSVIAWLFKLGVLLISLILIYTIARLFMPDMLTDMQTLPLLLGTLAFGIVCFVLYDVCLTQLITFYLVRLRQRFRLK